MEDVFRKEKAKAKKKLILKVIFRLDYLVVLQSLKDNFELDRIPIIKNLVCGIIFNILHPQDMIDLWNQCFTATIFNGFSSRDSARGKMTFSFRLKEREKKWCTRLCYHKDLRWIHENRFRTNAHSAIHEWWISWKMLLSSNCNSPESTTKVDINADPAGEMNENPIDSWHLEAKIWNEFHQFVGNLPV